MKKLLVIILSLASIVCAAPLTKAEAGEPSAKTVSANSANQKLRAHSGSRNAQTAASGISGA